MAAAAFDLLASPIQQSLWRLGWTELRPIQTDAIRAILQTDSDLIISAATASGKTEAAFLPIISELVTSAIDSVGAIYISPLKALINDQFRRLEELCEAAEIPVHRWHGDVGQSARAKLVKEPQGIVLTTPESLESMFINRSSALTRMYRDLRYVVIDELHAFVGRERGTHLRSLLHRLEHRIGRAFRVVALSATLGEWSGDYAEWIRPERGNGVVVLKDMNEEKTVRLKIYGYTIGEGDSPLNDGSTEDASYAIDDMLQAFGSRTGLIFANRKNDVELFADALNERCRRLGRRESFLVHHGSLSKEIREHTEQMMRGDAPYTTLCSSTLELGIDIGDVEAVGQIGSPWSVNSLIQRLGRSGRRGDAASEMRIFIESLPLHRDSDVVERLRPQFLQAVSLVELMREKWLEPPINPTSDFSTLIQQILSVLTETGGVSASELYSRLVSRGVFSGVSTAEFASLLRTLGEWKLVEQMAEGDLVVGVEGEWIVKSLDFYSAFAASKEFTVLHSGEAIGSISASDPPPPGDHLLLAGRRWQVVEVDSSRESISVIPAQGKKRAPFCGSAGDIHDRIREKMRELVLRDTPVNYLSATATEWLRDSRAVASAAGLDQSEWHSSSPERSFLFTWAGTRTQRTIVLLAKLAGIDAIDREIAVEFFAPEQVARGKLLSLLHQGVSDELLAKKEENQVRRKYDPYLPSGLRRKSFIEDALNVDNSLSLLSDACLDRGQ